MNLSKIMIKKRTNKFRIYPNKQQELILLEHIDLCRQTYNSLLGELNNQKEIDQSELSALIPDLKICNPKLNKVYAKSLQSECNRLFNNLRTLYSLKKKGRKVGRLRFKSKFSFKSITYNQSGFKLVRTGKKLQKLSLSKIGEIIIKKHRKIEGKIKQIIIKKTNSGKWFANISTEIKEEIKNPINNKKIGIDLGINNYIYDSEGNNFDNPKFLNKNIIKLRKLNRNLSNKKKGSNNRTKARLKVAKLHEKISYQRNDFLHKLSRNYVNNYSLIAIEKLQIKNMIKNNKLSRSISDASWAKFIQMLEYKAESAGVQVIKIDPRNTTQECSNCNKIVKKKLSERKHNCGCGLNIDRDYNSAINILNKIKTTVGSTGSNSWGNVSVETSMNQEPIKVIKNILIKKFLKI